MMQNVHAKLNPGFPRGKRHSTIQESFYLQTGLKFMKETSEALHL
jgi:hypothetical protein